jgi:PBP1b-binding outer membrane lipoprotein LpoB
MKKLVLLSTVLTALLAGCAVNETAPPCPADAAPENPAPQAANDFPTRDRVDYVMECIAKHGGLTYISQYACGCKIDKIAAQMSFADYEAARTFGQMQKTPGEAGAVFRDPQQSKDLRGQLKDGEAAAEKACFVK